MPRYQDATKLKQLTLFAESVPARKVLQAPAPAPYRPELPDELPDELTAAGWSLIWLDYGWVKATHPTLGETREHFPAPHRGLAWVEKDIAKLSKKEIV